MITAVANKNRIKIDPAKEINQGGEGTVYEVDSNTVAKIYHDGITPISQRKFDFLKRLDPNYFVAPLELIHDDKGLVIGYTMKYIDQTFFPLSNLYNKKFCKNNGITKKVKMRVIEKLIAAVKYAHKENVVIGDLNPFNILVNDRGVIKLIDTDSYQTPGFPHSHILLEEVRDYLYQGRVSEESDFFALSILAFNMLAFLHPFKGMHKQYKKIGDRMIHKLPVFINDPQIKIPKCYEPIQDKNFMSQFKKLYINGERFLLSLTGVDDSIIATSPLKKPSMVKKYEQDDLIITMISQGDEIVNVMFLSEQGIVETDGDYLIYNAKNKGYLNLKSRIDKKDWDDAFIGRENVLLRKGSYLYKHDKGKETKISNFLFPDNCQVHQLDNILIVIDEDVMYKVYLDVITSDNIQTERTGVFGKAFTTHSGLIHNSGGKQNLLYNSGRSVSIVPSLAGSILALQQFKNVGIVQLEEKKKVRYKMFKIDGLKMKISQRDFDMISNFTFIPNMSASGKEEREGTIFMPVDDRIELYRTNDFEKVGEMGCSIISSQTVLNKSNAGIIAWEGNTVALLNKK